LFVKNGYGKVTSREAFKFLQSITESREIKVRVTLVQGDQLSLKDWTELNISNKKIKGKLDLSDFINLKVLRCERNQLTDLNISNCSHLEELECRGNNFSVERNLILLNSLPKLKEE
jgi:Leucine-rich repeat (LRR) protein